MKKIFAILLCVTMLFGMTSTLLAAQDPLLTTTGLPLTTASAGMLTTTAAEGYDEAYYGKFRDAGITIYVYNWGENIADGSEDTMDVVKEFEELTGINVEYTTFDTNEGLYSKLQSGSAYYDVIIPSDYMISRMIKEDMLERLDLRNIPNFEKYIDAEFRTNVEYDPEASFSVPYTWGTVGIIYNTKYVTKPVDSWDILWDADYAGKILMFSNSRDAFAIAMAKLGYSVNTENEAEILEAAELLRAQKALVQAYVMDENYDKMEQENAWLTAYYAGDFINMQRKNPNLAFAFPKEGSNIFVDAMCIPKGSRNKEAAEMFINFMCEPIVSAENLSYIGYSTPSSAARALMDAEIAENEVIYPSEEIKANMESFVNLSDKTNKLLDDLWIDITVSGVISTGFWIAVAAVAVALAVFCIIAMNQKKKRALARSTETA